MENRLDALLNEGPFLSGSKEWTISERMFGVKGLPGFTNKMVIGSHDIYVKTGWRDAKIVWVDITLSRKGHKGRTVMATANEVNLEVTRFDLAKRALEVMSRQASDMLQSGQVGIGYVIMEWIGREMYPSGWCPELPMTGEDGTVGPSLVKGPTDAVAKLFQRRLVIWTDEMVKMEAEKRAEEEAEKVTKEEDVN